MKHINGKLVSPYENDQDRVKKSVRVDENGCWIWMYRKDKRGYGYATMPRRPENPLVMKAYKFSYIAFKGKPPAGLDLDHLCRVPSCVNPDHLEAVTHRENVMRSNAVTALNARKTHCKRGHKLAGSNLIEKEYKRGKFRDCRTCVNTRKRRYALEKRLSKV
jgi:hypothetical protein